MAQENHAQNPGRALIEHPLPSALSTQVTPLGGAHMRDFDDEFNFQEYLQVVLRHKWTVLGFAAVVLIGVFTATILMTPIYRATTVLQIERESAKVVSYKDVAPDESRSSYIDFYQTQYELLKSKALAERVVEHIGLERIKGGKISEKKADLSALLSPARQEGKTPSESEAARIKRRGEAAAVKQMADVLRLSLTVQPVAKSRLVEVSFDSESPELAALVANSIAQNFIALNLERRFDASSYAKSFLEERIAQTKLKLEEAERAQLEYAREKGIINVDKEGVTTSEQNLAEFNMALSKAEQNRIQAESLFMQLAASGSGDLPQVLENPLIQNLMQTKAKLESSYQEKLQTFKPGYPAMQELKGQIEEVSAQLEKEKANVRNSIRASYQAAKAQEELIRQKLGESKSDMIDQQTHNIQYNILKRESDTNRQLYDGLLQRLKEVSVAGGVETNNVFVVDKAEVPGSPFKPDMRKNLILALLIGLIGGVGLAFFIEHLDDTFRQTADVERHLGMPVLGLVPESREMLGGMTALQVAVDDPRSALTESYRSLRTALQFSRAGGAPQVLAFTSTEMGEGKSTSALSLAIQIAQTGKTVLLIDADLRNPSMHRVLKNANENGLTNFLVGVKKPSEITFNTPIEKLYFVPAGTLPPNPAELLSSSRMVDLLDLARTKFDHVIIDSPPILGLADALVIANIVDGMVLVVAAGQTRKRSVQAAVKRLHAVQAKLVGGLLTKMRSHTHGYGYEYYYAYGGKADKETPKQGA